MVSSSEIRQQFIDFFCKQRGHKMVPSSSVVPHDDPTLLFTNAGMNQFKPYFLGTEKPPVTRVANTQKCIRAGGKHNDLDDVGKDTYHHTFFEMLGNWSFGDYFKKDAITWAWELLTVVWKLDPTRLHVTVFEGDHKNGIPRDDEAAELWKQVGVLPDHIHLGNAKDNFWEMGDTGPCGPCTEVHIDRTPGKTGGNLVNAGTPDVIEIWNNVFIQFNRNADRSLTPLPAQHVDTGMGFERICSVLQGKDSNYDTDIFMPIFDAIHRLTGVRPYTAKLDDLTDIAYRVVGDHIRTLSFALTDGAKIGNDGRDYVLKRILRRAERYGRQYLGADGPFLHQLVPTVVELMSGAFPELAKNPERVRNAIYAEEVAFIKNLDRGMKLFMQLVEKTRAEGGTVVSGVDAFTLHDTYGVYIDITQQMASEQGISVDFEGYTAAMTDAKERARKGGKTFVVSAVKGELPTTDDSPKYQPEPISAKLLGWVIDNSVITTGKLSIGQTAALLVDRTLFYAEQGGQVGDTGTIRTASGAEFTVKDTQRLGETVLHFGTLLEGELEPGQTVELLQSTLRRIDIARNHTATHLMNLALRTVLDGQVEQKGSLVDDSKTRFDFNSDKPLSAKELREVESYVNDRISRDLTVTAVSLPLADAKKVDGVQAVFGEKYPDPVRVVMIGPTKPEHANFDDSIEFCGGTHVDRTGSIGYFKIVSQEPVAKGVRRIVAVSGRMSAVVMDEQAKVLSGLTEDFKCKPDELPTRIQSLRDETARVSKLLDLAIGMTAQQIAKAAPSLNGTTLIVGHLPSSVGNAGQVQSEVLKKQYPSSLIIFGWDDGDGKALISVALTMDLVKRGLKAGDVLKPLAELIGGKGGGKPDFAQAGGKDVSKLATTLTLASEMAKKLLDN